MDSLSMFFSTVRKANFVRGFAFQTYRIDARSMYGVIGEIAHRTSIVPPRVLDGMAKRRKNKTICGATA